MQKINGSNPIFVRIMVDGVASCFNTKVENSLLPAPSTHFKVIP